MLDREFKVLYPLDSLRSSRICSIFFLNSLKVDLIRFVFFCKKFCDVLVSFFNEFRKGVMIIISIISQSTSSRDLTTSYSSKVSKPLIIKVSTRCLNLSRWIHASLFFLKIMMQNIIPID
eukprot:GHVH01010429.1.p1 GENE.GHVH01010429.1~~GHVH01010429.1.p1  ORF type:complete len:120 (+),score=2.21 GHVH01010429.1:597-956(+)